MTPTRWRRVRGWWRRGRQQPPSYDDDGTLPVVGGSSDPARADSAVVAEMAAAGVDLDRPVLVRHHLLLPDAGAVEEARRLLAPDGYAVRAQRGEPAAGWVVRASRTQILTGLSAAQERSRMAGLAQRLGGEATGWDACAPRAASTRGDGRTGRPGR
jgi:hypothetical protein